MASFGQGFYQMVSYEARTACNKNLRHSLTCGVINRCPNTEPLATE
ncbi:hypothetical protein THTE_3359 [Thermogutta terrifontis]|uniref:Uncharacterized protein n=1 Tax=Thermogutta terrifontis TaxID=1331910 RepID=A0A286RJ16_9BACT|nr:hypothetical protein THTE_3359 [Thermogutta terrifontis]